MNRRLRKYNELNKFQKELINLRNDSEMSRFIIGLINKHCWTCGSKAQLKYVSSSTN